MEFRGEKDGLWGKRTNTIILFKTSSLWAYRRQNWEPKRHWSLSEPLDRLIQSI